MANDNPSRLFDILTFNPFATIIIDYLGPADLVNLTSTSRLLRAFRPQIWNINAHLTHFVEFPAVLRSLMAQYDGIISGSNALQFLSRRHFKGSDLDIYLNGSTALIEFTEYLTRVEGYQYAPYWWQEENWETAIRNRVKHANSGLQRVRERYQTEQEQRQAAGMSSISDEGEVAYFELKTLEGVFLLQKPGRDGEPMKQIQLIATRECPIYAILNDFFLTNIFNFYTWDKAYSLFPYHTFVHEDSFMTRPATSKIKKFCEKYQHRGWDVKRYDSTTHQCLSSHKSCEIRTSRRVGDKFSWILDLDTTGVEPPSAEQSVSLLGLCTFGLSVTRAYKNMFDEEHQHFHPFLKLSTEPFHSISLKNSLVVDSLPGNQMWKEFLTDMLTQVQKLDEQLLNERFQLEAGDESVAERNVFKYHDDEVQTWYDMHEKWGVRRERVGAVQAVWGEASERESGDGGIDGGVNEVSRERMERERIMARIRAVLDV